MESKSDRILREAEVKRRTGLSRVQRWRCVRAKPPTFPAPVQLGPNSIGWRESDIAAWLADRPTVSWGRKGDVEDGE